MRDEISALVALGPEEQGAQPEMVERHEKAVKGMFRPVNDEEARELPVWAEELRTRRERGELCCELATGTHNMRVTGEGVL
jgi:hypothetical protein